MATERCSRCRGDGYFWRVPDGFNPFSAGGWATARASWKVHCYECKGTGRLECVCEAGHDRPYWKCPAHGDVLVDQ